MKTDLVYVYSGQSRRVLTIEELPRLLAAGLITLCGECAQEVQPGLNHLAPIYHSTQPTTEGIDRLLETSPDRWLWFPEHPGMPPYPPGVKDPR